MTELIRFLADNRKDIGLSLLGIAVFFATQIIFGGC